MNGQREEKLQSKEKSTGVGGGSPLQEEATHSAEKVERTQPETVANEESSAGLNDSDRTLRAHRGDGEATDMPATHSDVGVMSAPLQADNNSLRKAKLVTGSCGKTFRESWYLVETETQFDDQNTEMVMPHYVLSYVPTTGR